MRTLTCQYIKDYMIRRTYPTTFQWGMVSRIAVYKTNLLDAGFPPRLATCTRHDGAGFVRSPLPNGWKFGGRRKATG